MTKKAAKKSPSKKKSAPNTEIAAAMRQMEKLMAGGDLITQDDLDALLASLHGQSATDGLSDEEADAKAEAQDLAFEAMEAETEAQARKLAQKYFGEIPRGEAAAITGLGDRMGRVILSQLTARGLLISDTPKGPVRLGLPTDDVDRLFPKLFYEV